MSLADIRIEYGKRGLKISDCAETPHQQLSQWLHDALEAEVSEPNAMHLATVSASGHPSGRIVLLKGLEADGLYFYTNYQSRKGQQLAENPAASATFFWPDLERQVRIEGQIRRASPEQSDAYFASRPYSSRIGAWVSEQSQTLASPTLLVEREAQLKVSYPDQVPRPPHWGGYVLSVQRAEFWQGRPSRLHDRVLFTPTADGNWLKQLLQP